MTPPDGDRAPDRPRQRPGWWPDDEPWPPTRWRGPPWWGRRGGGPPWGPGAWHADGPPWHPGRRAVARRFGCFIALMLVTAGSVGIVITWLLASLLGLVEGEGGVAYLARGAGIVLLLAGGAALVVGIRLARGIGPPLGDLVEAAGRVEAGDYSVRVPVATGGPSELRDLGRAFNTMTARLEVDETQRRQLLAEISHELRTPLAVIQGNLEGLVDGVYPADDAHLGPILEETRVMARLIEDLRTLSLAEAGTLALHREPTDLGILIADVVGSSRVTAEAAEVHVEPTIDDDLPLLDVDPIRIREVLGNLVANALRYAPRESAIRIRASIGKDGVAVEVADDGPGIPPELLATVFERFTKSAESRGSGLGLAIARAIVNAHGGEIGAESGPGHGTTIRFVLPTH